jgi:flagellar basal body-associated protein FliL
MQIFILLLVLHVLLLVVSFGVRSTHMASSKYRTPATDSCSALSSYSAVHFLCSKLKL